MTVDELMALADALSDRVYDNVSCYRCWQIGAENVTATCMVRYNVGTPHEWTSLSCSICADADVSRFPGRTIVVDVMSEVFDG